jgi:transposase
MPSWLLSDVETGGLVAAPGPPSDTVPAPNAQRGKAKRKRSDLRIVGLGLVVTRDGGIPLTWHAYPGDRPDVTQFTTMIGQLRSQYENAGVRV